MCTFPFSKCPHRFLGLAVIAMALILGGCGNGESADEPAYQVGDPLSDSTLALVVSSDYGADTLDVNQYQGEIQKRLQRLSPEERSPDTLQSIHREIVRRIADVHAMRGEAESEDIQVDTTQVSARLQKLKQQYPSEEQFQQQLAQQNLTLDSLRSLIASQLQAQSLQRQMADEASSPTSSEVQKYSEENIRVRAQHLLIQVGPNAPEAEEDSARQLASSLIDSARSGVDFAELVRRHSDDPRSAQQGGDLGYFTEEEMAQQSQAFSDAVFALADSGDVTPEPVRTQAGFHVVRLTDSGQPMDTTKARQRLMQERREQAYEDELDKLLDAVTIRVNSDVVEAGFYEEQ